MKYLHYLSVVGLLSQTCSGLENETLSDSVPKNISLTQVVREEDQWVIMGNFEPQCEDDYYEAQKYTYKSMVFESIVKNYSIRNIWIIENDVNGLFITVSVYQEIKKLTSVFLEKQLGQYNDESKKSYRSTDKEKISEFLEVLYQELLIPDFIIDIVIKKLKIEDFRLSSEKLTHYLNSHLQESSSLDSYIGAIHKYMKQVKNERKRQEILANFIINTYRNTDISSSLNEDENTPLTLCPANEFIHSLCRELCKDITDSTLPLFAQINTIAVELNFTASLTSAELPDLSLIYQEPIINLLQATTDPSNTQGKALLSIYLKSFFNKGLLGGQIPEKLMHITFSPKDMFYTLNCIRILLDKLSTEGMQVLGDKSTES